MNTDVVDKSTLYKTVDKSTIYEAVETSFDPTIEFGLALAILDDDGFLIVDDDGGLILGDL